MYLEDFKNHLLVRDASLNYFKQIRIFLNWCKDNQRNSLQPSEQLFTDYLAACKLMGAANGSMNVKINALKSYYKYLMNFKGQSSTGIEILKKFTSLPKEDKKKLIVDEFEIKQLIGFILTEIKRLSPERIKTIVYFLFFTGVRAEEIIELKRSDIDLEKNRALIKVPTKNRTEHYVLFPPELAKLIKDYFASEPEKTNAFNLTYDKLRYIFEKINQFLIKEKKLTAHSMRHSFACNLAEKGVDIYTTQNLMGHKDIDTTLIYYRKSDKAIEKVYHEKVRLGGDL